MQGVAEQMASDTGRRVIVRSADGTAIADSAGELIGHTVPGPSEVGPDVLILQYEKFGPDGSAAERDVKLSLGRAPATLDEPAASGQPPKIPGTRLALPRLDAEQVFATSVWRALIVGVFVGGLGAVLLALVFSGRILRPIELLTLAARRFEAGDLDQRVPEAGEAEIAQLGHAFNSMAAGLARTEHLRRTMVTDIAHELRTPLSNVRSYLEALEDGVLQPSADILECLRDESAHLARLVDDLQELSLAEAGQMRLDRQAVRPGELLFGITQVLRAQAEARGLTLELDVGADLPPVLADETRLGQVVRNLVSNAITHTPAGGTIVVRGTATTEGVCISVSDTGSGIPAEHLPYIFERFYRADRSRARSTGGAGLGLAIARQLVRAHNGDIAVESALGRGTTFRFTLPKAVVGASGKVYSTRPHAAAPADSS